MEVFVNKNNWQEKSLCRKEKKFNPETKQYVPYTIDDFYPTAGKKVSEEIKKMCKRCPVNIECLEQGLIHEKYGEWGGVSEKQRRIIRRQRDIKFVSPQSN